MKFKPKTRPPALSKFSILVTPDVHAKLAAIAQLEGIAIAGLVRQMIEHCLSKDESEVKP